MKKKNSEKKKLSLSKLKMVKIKNSKKIFGGTGDGANTCLNPETGSVIVDDSIRM